MPSRSAHRAALRRSREPSVIAPEGMTLPELPQRLGWRNPMRGDHYVRNEWELYRVSSIDAYTIATVLLEQAGDRGTVLTFRVPPESTSSMSLAQAFEAVAEFVSRQGKEHSGP
ncbi:hypothetical protein FHY35_004061 [Xanthomonas arboricola]|uniref:hypothetical protein n=1 Tax=Xanthomonas arboricola TaxID=56448 RepID=UPI00141AA870|nr:hypothetical protein [Xanthomonas arboricola]NIJ87011.1 hypothetical protein [Xanthomonas arboricola]